MKKLVVVLLVLMFIVSSVVACGAPAASEEPAEKKSEKVEAEKDDAASAEPVTLRFMWWGGDDRHQATLALIDRYAEETGIVIQAEYQGWEGYEQKMMTQLASGTAPDLIQMDSPWLLNFAEKDLFVDLTDNANIDFAQFDQEF